MYTMIQTTEEETRQSKHAEEHEIAEHRHIYVSWGTPEVDSNVTASSDGPQLTFRLCS